MVDEEKDKLIGMGLEAPCLCPHLTPAKYPDFRVTVAKMHLKSHFPELG
jgi:hypothetical protein